MEMWLLASALLIAGGWLLSALHGLNAGGYLGLLLCVGIVLRLWLKKRAGELPSRLSFNRRRRFRARFRRPLPLAFLLLAALAILGGLLYAPNNYDGLTYRLPRMLNWAADGHWSWIHSINPRLNDRGSGCEWLTMPLLILTGSDRAFFLPNVLSFLLLPGLTFSLLTRLGLASRVAWHWMWLLPSGYCFVLQAGGSSNDLPAVPYALAAVVFALKARQSRRPADAWLSVLAAGLMTAVKASNLTLLLPWIFALAPCWKLLRKTPMASTGVFLLGAAASFLPNALLNARYCGDWSGAVLEPGLSGASPSVALAGGVLLLFIQNIVPPVFPWAGWCGEHWPSLLPGTFRAALDNTFEHGWQKLSELPIEDRATLGFGVAVLLGLSLGWIARQRRQQEPPVVWWSKPGHYAGAGSFILACLPWISVLGLMAKISIAPPGRILTPVYILLTPLLLWHPLHRRLVGRRWWRPAGLAVMALSALVVILNPARPLWPTQTILRHAGDGAPGHPWLQRAARVYAVYGRRADALAPIRDLIPAGVSRVGLVTNGDEPEGSLWRPFGSRRVVHVLPADTAEDLRRQSLEYVIVSENGLRDRFKMNLPAWLRKLNAEVVYETSLSILASWPASAWYLVRLRAPAGAR
jgi:hypothetical protein